MKNRRIGIFGHQTSLAIEFGVLGLALRDRGQNRGKSGYKCWLKYIMANLGPKPSPKHSLDRYPNPGGNYEPGNIRWATAKEQRANQRPCRKDDQKVAT